MVTVNKAEAILPTLPIFREPIFFKSFAVFKLNLGPLSQFIPENLSLS
jgi:hypothetical protein